MPSSVTEFFLTELWSRPGTEQFLIQGRSRTRESKKFKPLQILGVL